MKKCGGGLGGGVKELLMGSGVSGGTEEPAQALSREGDKGCGR